MFWPDSVGFWSARFNSRVVVGQNECRWPGKRSVCKPVLKQIKGSSRKSTVDLGETKVDLGLGLAGRYFIEGGRQAVFFNLFGEDVPSDPGEDLFLKPVGIAVDFPFAEVLLIDGPSAEVLLEDSLDFGKAVEPGDEAGAGNAIVNGTTNLVANFIGQVPDFTGMRTNF